MEKNGIQNFEFIRVTDSGLEKGSSPATEENIFITSTCGDKGISYLTGSKPMGIRYNEAEEKKKAVAAAPAAAPCAPKCEKEASYTITVNGKAFNVHVAPGGAITSSPAQGHSAAAAQQPSSAAAYELKAPLPGTVVRILAEAGDNVEAGEPVMVLEAMKMETEIKTDKAGKIADILVSQGDTVAAGQAIILIEE